MVTGGASGMGLAMGLALASAGANVSLGSLLGSAAMFPAMLLIWAVASGWVAPAYLIWAAVGPILIWLAHADNIDRLLHGKERKFDLSLLADRGRQGGA